MGDTSVCCLICGREVAVSFADCLRHGWPTCCQQTMTLLPVAAGVVKAATDGIMRDRDRPLAQVMLDWGSSRNHKRQRVAREYWEDYESGRPTSDSDR